MGVELYRLMKKSSWSMLALMLLGLLACMAQCQYLEPTRVESLATRHEVPPDADVGLNFPEIVAKRGFSLETHYVTTSDGYILTMFRIPSGSSSSDKLPVILQHGLLDSSFTWVSNFRDQSLGYLLADAGYDVWFGNNRGNYYSSNHTTLDPASRKPNNPYWKFSLDEMAKYDAPSFIDYVLKQTGASKVNWVGHSEGTMQVFAGGTYPLCSGPKCVTAPIPQYEKINLFVALAPVGAINHIKSPEIKALAASNITQQLVAHGDNKFLPKREPGNTGDSKICQEFSTGCDAFLMSLCGPSKNANVSRLQVYMDQTPAGTSVQNMLHFQQGVIAQQEDYFLLDYGSEGNVQHYGSSEIPVYDLTKFKIKTAIFSGGNDWMADPTDVQKLYDKIPAEFIVARDFQRDYNHMDFVWSPSAAKRIYGKVAHLLEKQY